MDRYVLITANLICCIRLAVSTPHARSTPWTASLQGRPVQVHTQHEAATKLMKETKTAITEFEATSDSVQWVGHNLDTALRGLGDVENFLEILSVRDSTT